MLVRSGSLLLLATGIGSLAGCADPAKPAPAAFTPSGQSWNLLVDRLEVEVAYVAPKAAPNIDHSLSPTPTQAAELWARRKLVPRGAPAPGTIARFIIRRASIVETPLATPGGLRGMIVDDAAFRYDAILEADLEIRNATGFRDRQISVRQDASRTVKERATFDERKAAWIELTNDLVEQMGRSFDQAIPANFGPVLTY
ncbi:hypothetical protein VZ95_01945 [Elstera litoralis]|uniref:Lipoprotein n=1 Tax=Elstera litoralis TaxID=552518 RepID=A0A0F3IW23_9PROT|nr:hypothetical protein [Elstera litoralis]KJV10896.1 hypothetical protein VZ95_01945 [Elstera litoralis]